MLDIAPVLNVESTEEWGELDATLRSGLPPQALSATLQQEAWEEFRDLYARRVLCASGTGEDGCAGCRGWMPDGHPDLVIAGVWGSPPGVEGCLAFQAALQLKPVASVRRLGVVACADELSLPAANSLLKLTEEPPEGVHLLFLSESGNLIPTIKSRVWSRSFGGEDRRSAEPSPPPSSPSEWAAWFEATKKLDLPGASKFVDSWADWLASKGEWLAAAELKNFLYIADKRHMPVSMVQDALYVILREGVRVEEIFGDLRET